MTQDKLELFIKMRAQELYQEWCNSPDTTVSDVIARGMVEAVRQSRQAPVVELEPTGDYQVDANRFAKEGGDGAMEYVEGVLTIDGELAQNIFGLASAFVLDEAALLTHLVSLGKLAASTELFIKNKSGAFVALGDIE